MHDSMKEERTVDNLSKKDVSFCHYNRAKQLLFSVFRFCLLIFQVECKFLSEQD